MGIIGEARQENVEYFVTEPLARERTHWGTCLVTLCLHGTHSDPKLNSKTRVKQTVFLSSVTRGV